MTTFGEAHLQKIQGQGTFCSLAIFIQEGIPIFRFGG